MNEKIPYKWAVSGFAFCVAAVGGLVASQSAPQVIGVSAQPPPAIPHQADADLYQAQTDDFALWSKAFVQQALIAQPEATPWRFIGVIGQGLEAKAVFVSPERIDQSVLVGQGDSLPDGRVVAAVASQHVLFAKKTNGAVGSVAASTGPTNRDEVSLMMKYDAAAEPR